jgi:hypothetical protein
VLAALHTIVLSVLDRARLDGWHREWAAVEPTWTRRGQP